MLMNIFDELLGIYGFKWPVQLSNCVSELSLASKTDFAEFRIQFVECGQAGFDMIHTCRKIQDVVGLLSPQPRIEGYVIRHSARRLRLSDSESLFRQ
jgi:hypothetical protein